jgi:hypothetical protein
MGTQGDKDALALVDGVVDGEGNGDVELGHKLCVGDSDCVDASSTADAATAARSARPPPRRAAAHASARSAMLRRTSAVVLSLPLYRPTSKTD